jgi:hypothetical protein
MLAHVAATAIWWGEEHGLSSPQCLIDVEVKGDHEFFPSPESFADRVTIQALRHFGRIVATVWFADDLVVRVDFVVIERNWWLGVTEGYVDLSVGGKHREAVDSVPHWMCRAIARGGTASWKRLTVDVVPIAIGLVTGVIGAVTFLTALYLLKVPRYWSLVAVISPSSLFLV